MSDTIVTTTPETLFNDDFPELESLSAEAKILCVDRNTETDLMEGYQAPLSLLKGDKGDKGDTGAKGDTGERGPRGYQGETGDKGDKGDKGEKGDKGDTGATGPQGPQGLQGVTGPQGPQGPKGEDGTPGATGPAGPAGATGNGIASITSNKVGKTTTVTITETNGTTDTFQVLDGQDGAGSSYTPGANIQINGNVISATDTTYENKQAEKDGTAVSLVDTGEKYMWNKGLIDANTKSFSLTGTTGSTNIATAQEAYDWYKAGHNPIIMYDGSPYFVSAQSGSILSFLRAKETMSVYNSDRSCLVRQKLDIRTSNDVVSSIASSSDVITKYLDTDTAYSNTYTPQYDGSPATKKYVDNKVTTSASAPSSPAEGMLWYDTTNDVLKVYDGSAWQSVGSGGGGGGGDVVVSSQANNAFTSGLGIWGGLSTDFANLTKQGNTLYITYDS